MELLRTLLSVTQVITELLVSTRCVHVSTATDPFMFDYFIMLHVLYARDIQI